MGNDPKSRTEFQTPADMPLCATIRFSHTSPIYLDLAEPTTIAEDVHFFLEWINREMRLYQVSTAFRREADRAAMLDFFARARAIYEGMAR